MSTMTNNRMETVNNNKKGTLAERIGNYFGENTLLIAGGLAFLTGNTYAATQLMRMAK
ncbi:hypothetical protein [Mediterraneibacter faecis]|uniref:hypothetical protein n=1 Tax=Mediterraneibacter faecis TaxID=592978 RepID=UPI0022E4CDF7|nr:hypothetical protein [Mediterraneibacter faecis]